jgi:hypothetical protein
MVTRRRARLLAWAFFPRAAVPGQHVFALTILLHVCQPVSIIHCASCIARGAAASYALCQCEREKLMFSSVAFKSRHIYNKSVVCANEYLIKRIRNVREGDLSGHGRMCVCVTEGAK